jgi:CheY-like chemotaxis protein
MFFIGHFPRLNCLWGAKFRVVRSFFKTTCGGMPRMNREFEMAKVIVCDDSLAELKLVESVLVAGGHQAISCVNGDGVEALASSEQPDLIFLDVVMPTRNGYEILRKLRRDETTKNIPVCILSSKQEPTDIEWGKRQGANDYLTKPYTADALLGVVRNLTNK